MSDMSLATTPPRVVASPAEARAPQDLRGLHYPFGRWVPESGTMFEVAPGVHWTRMPLPFGIDHINLWVLDAGDGWAIVDTGVNMPRTRGFWAARFGGPMVI